MSVGTNYIIPLRTTIRNYLTNASLFQQQFCARFAHDTSELHPELEQCLTPTSLAHQNFSLVPKPARKFDCGTKRVPRQRRQTDDAGVTDSEPTQPQPLATARFHLDDQAQAGQPGQQYAEGSPRKVPDHASKASGFRPRIPFDGARVACRRRRTRSKFDLDSA